MNNDFTIGKKSIGRGHTFIIGEIAQAHDGSLGMAHAFIDAIANNGADAVKFQTHIAEAESSLLEPWRIKFSPQDATRFDYWKRMEFTREQWIELKKHSEDRGLIFLSSPFSMEAVELLIDLKIDAWKVASGEVSNHVMLKRMGVSGKPVILSSGMSSIQELDDAVFLIRDSGSPLAVLQCTSSYPTPPEKIGLNLLNEYKNRYCCPIGLSDHSGSIFASLAAVAKGADIIEVHVTLSRDMFGPDVVASITSNELKKLVDGIRFIERINENPVEKDLQAEQMYELRKIFSKSIFLKEDVEAGTILEEKHLIGKKPGTGIPINKINDIIGRRLYHDRKMGWQLTDSDLVKVDVKH